MSTETIVCPGCGASDPSAVDRSGIHTCAYCGARYRTKPSGDVHLVDATRRAAASQGRTRWFVVGITAVIAMIVLASAGALIVFGQGANDLPSSARANSAARRAQPTTTPRVAPPHEDKPAAARNRTVSVSAPAPEEPAVAPSATFEFHRHLPGHKTSFYALGWVMNTSPFTISKPAITAVLLDGSDQEVGTHKGFAIPTVLRAGEKSPVSILINQPEPHERIAFEVAARKASYIPENVSGLLVVPGQVKRASFGKGWKITGKVKHEGDTAAKFVQIVVLGLDADDKLLGVHSTFADTQLLAPGETTRFSVPFATFAEDPVRFEYSVSGQSAAK